MNKIVRHYPIEKLPADLREGLPDAGHVRIELVPEKPAGERVLLAPLAGSGRNVHGSEDEVLRHIRELREDR